MSTDTDTDHSHYVNAVARVLVAAGLTLAEYEALDDTHREAYIKLAPTTDPVTEIESSVVLTWDEDLGWRHGFTETHRAERGIQCLSELMCDDRYIETVALPTTVADALLKLTHTVPDDLDKALAAYLPGGQAGATASDPGPVPAELTAWPYEDRPVAKELLDIAAKRFFGADPGEPMAVSLEAAVTEVLAAAQKQ